MGISIQEKSDYSYLFSGLSTSSSTSTNNFLGEYASIKNGSYSKLMKAYYSDSASSEVSSLVNSQSKVLTEVQDATDKLKDSADALLETGTSAVINSGDTDKISSAVNSFVDNYNSVINKMENVDSATVLNKTVSLTNLTKANESLLSKVGITINSDNTLSVDEETLKTASSSTLKSLFNGHGSYGYSVSAQASLINYAADNALNKSSFYTSSGTYSSTSSSGSIFDSLF